MKCAHCKLTKSPSEFYETNHSRCKDCIKLSTKLWRKDNKAKWIKMRAKSNKKYRLANKEKASEYYKAWYQRTHRYRHSKAIKENTLDKSSTVSL